MQLTLQYCSHYFKKFLLTASIDTFFLPLRKRFKMPIIAFNKLNYVPFPQRMMCLFQMMPFKNTTEYFIGEKKKKKLVPGRIWGIFFSFDGKKIVIRKVKCL